MNWKKMKSSRAKDEQFEEDDILESEEEFEDIEEEFEDT